jgi:hypothetical protein
MPQRPVSARPAHAPPLRRPVTCLVLRRSIAAISSRDNRSLEWRGTPFLYWAVRRPPPRRHEPIGSAGGGDRQSRQAHVSGTDHSRHPDLSPLEVGASRVHDMMPLALHRMEYVKWMRERDVEMQQGAPLGLRKVSECLVHGLVKPRRMRGGWRRGRCGAVRRRCSPAVQAQSGDREVAQAGHGPGARGAVSLPVQVAWTLLRPFMKSPSRARTRRCARQPPRTWRGCRAASCEGPRGTHRQGVL